MVQNPALIGYQAREGITPIHRMRPVPVGKAKPSRDGGTKFMKW